MLASTKVELAEPPRKMGEGERHLDLRVRHYGKVMRAIAFGRGEWAGRDRRRPGTDLDHVCR